MVFLFKDRSDFNLIFLLLLSVALHFHVWMHPPLIIANEDNTQIFVNGNTVAATTLNAGDYYLVDNSYYQGTINKNVFVKVINYKSSNKNLFVSKKRWFLGRMGQLVLIRRRISGAIFLGKVVKV